MSHEAYQICRTFSDSQLYEIAVWKRQGLTWDQITDRFNKKFEEQKTTEAIRHAFRRFGHLFELDNKDFDLRRLREVARTKKSNSRVQKENRLILEYFNDREDLVDAVKDAVKAINKRKPIKLKKINSRSGDKMTVEILLSDTHFGKKTDTYDFEVAKKRIIKYMDSAIKEIERSQKIFSMDRIILAILGDILENYQMHQLESARGCEFSNPRQVQVSIELLFTYVIEPLAVLGIPMDIIGVTGNHDRTGEKRTYHNPGEENLTWIIYNTLKFMSERAGYKHLTFHIPRCSYAVLNIYGTNVLYEHYDNTKNCSLASLQSLMMKRQNQLDKVIKFMRGGHYHEYTVFGRGSIIVNGCLSGQDSFADVHGYDTEPCQVINFYVETKKRPTPFYKSFPVSLG